MQKITVSLIALGMLMSLWLIFKPANQSAFDQREVINKPHLLKRQDFSLPDLKGDIQSFSKWNNKVVLLNFWATWCPPCRREMPDFIEVYEHYKDKGFVVVGVGIDDEKKVAEFVKHLNVTYPILVGGRTAMKVSHLYGNRQGALPYSIIIDRNGVIRYRAGGLMSKNTLINQITPLL